MNGNIAWLIVVLLFGLSPLTAQTDACKLQIGVSLHPYYSWVKNIVGDDARVTPLISPGSDPDSHQPMPADIVQTLIGVTGVRK